MSIGMHGVLGSGRTELLDGGSARSGNVCGVGVAAATLILGLCGAHGGLDRLLVSPAWAQPTWHVVAVSNRPAAWVPNSNWGTLALRNVAPGRRVCFEPQTLPLPVGNPREVLGVYRSGQYGVSVVQGDQLPGAAQGVVYASFIDGGVDETGAISFWASLSGTGVTPSNDQVIERRRINEQLFRYREMDAAPGIDGAVLANFGFPLSIAQDGTITFRGLLTGPGITATNNDVVFIRDPNQPGNAPSLLVRERSTIGASDLVLLIQQNPQALAGGRGIFGSTLGLQGTQSGLVAGPRQGDLVAFARSGETLPDLAPGQIVQSVGSRFAVAPDGQVAIFEAGVANPATRGVWVRRGDLTRKVALRGEPVVDSPGSTFLDLSASNYPPGVYAGNNGHVAFYAGLGGIPGGRALLVASFDQPTPRLAMRTSTDVPGFPGFVLADAMAGQIFLDGSGNAVFAAQVQGAALNQVWLFAWTPQTGVRVLLRPNQQLQLAGNDTRTILSINFSGSVDPPIPSGQLVTEDGMFAVKVVFTDQSQAILTSQIPGTCNDIDFNNDLVEFDPLDIDAFFSVFSEGPCLPVGAVCDSIDFNNDGSRYDPQDVDAFLSVFSEGPCR